MNQQAGEDKWVLNVQERTQFGSSNSKRVRKEGRIPSAIYCGTDKPIHCEMVANDFIKAASNAKVSQVFTLKSSDSRLDKRNVLVKEVQQDYVRGKVLHIEMIALEKGRPVKVQVPVFTKGDPKGVKIQGGFLDLYTRDITVRCSPELIPSQIDVDLSEMAVGDKIRTGDLSLPAGVKLHGNPLEIVASVIAKRREVVESTAPAAGVAAEGAEGEAAAPAEGAAPAAAKAPGKEAAPAKEG